MGFVTAVIPTLLLLNLLFQCNKCIQTQPNPPNWPEGVYIFDPSDPTTAQDTINTAFGNNGGTSPACNGQWSTDRYAFFFKQGTHSVSVEIGYYTSVYGLGMSPTDTVIQEVSCPDGATDYTVGALDNFWRSAENFEMTPTTTYNDLSEPTMLWAVSQAAPLRRVVINGGISLYQYNDGDCCAGYASGGFIADSKIGTTVYSGSQQQFIARNIDITTGWENGVWNIVLVGCDGSLPTNSDGNCYPYTIVDSTPIIAEKPFIYYDDSSNKYSIIVPQVETDKVGAGTNWGTNYDTIDFTNVYVVSTNTSIATINTALVEGYSIVFGPGIYNFTTTIEIGNDNTVILGIGFPTIICENNNGMPCFVVADGVTGVRIAGLLLQAGNIEYGTTSLLQMGSNSSDYRYSLKEKKFRKIETLNKKYKRHHFDIKRNTNKINNNFKDSTDYNFIIDVFARVGGTNDPSDYQVATTYMIDINMDNVIIDDTWLWRADHDITGSVYNSNNPVNSGIVINGDNVIAYGLAAEHTLGNLVEWNGNNGETYFYQSEYPYDVTQENYGDLGYVAYNVTSLVTSHSAYGVGAYSYFRDNVVTVNSGFACPSSGSTFTDAVTIFLNGNGEISHVVNDEGDAVNSGNIESYLCSL